MAEGASNLGHVGRSHPDFRRTAGRNDERAPGHERFSDGCL